MSDEELLETAESSFKTANRANGIPSQEFQSKCFESIAASLLVIARSTQQNNYTQDVNTEPLAL